MSLLSVTVAHQDAKAASLGNPLYSADLVEAKLQGKTTALDDSQKRHVQFRPLLSLFLDVRARRQKRSLGLQAQDDLTRYYHLLQLRQRELRARFTADELLTVLRAIEGREWGPRTLLAMPAIVRAADEALGRALADLIPEDLDAIRDMGLLLQDAKAQLSNWSAGEVETFFARRDRQRHELLVQEHNEQIEGGCDLRKGHRKTVVKQI